MEDSLNDRSWTLSVTHADRLEQCQKLVDKATNLYPIVPARSLQEKISDFEKGVYNMAKSKDEYMCRLSEGMAKVENSFEERQNLNAAQEEQMLDVQSQFVPHQFEIDPQHYVGDQQQDVNGNMTFMAYDPYHMQGQHGQMLAQQIEMQQNNPYNMQAPGQQDAQGQQMQQSNVQSGEQQLSHLEQIEYERLLELFADNAQTVPIQAQQPYFQDRPQMAPNQSLMEAQQQVLFQPPHIQQFPQALGQMAPNQSNIEATQKQKNPAKEVSAKKPPRVSKPRARGGSSAAAMGARGGRAKTNKGGTRSRAKNPAKKASQGQKPSKTGVQATIAGTPMLSSNAKPSAESSQGNRGKTKHRSRKAHAKSSTPKTKQGHPKSITGVQTAAARASTTRGAPASMHPGSAGIEASSTLPMVHSNSNLATPSQTGPYRPLQQDVCSIPENGSATQGNLQVDGKQLPAPSDESLWAEITLLQQKYRADLHQVAPLAKTIVGLQSPEAQAIFWECLDYCLYIVNLERSAKVPALVTATRLKTADSFSRHVISQAKSVMQAQSVPKGVQNAGTKRCRDPSQQAHPKKKQRRSPSMPQVQNVSKAQDSQRQVSPLLKPPLDLSSGPGARGIGAVPLQIPSQGHGAQSVPASMPSLINAHQAQPGDATLQQGAKCVGAQDTCMESTVAPVAPPPPLAALEEAIRHLESSTNFALECAERLDEQREWEKAERIKDTFRALRDGSSCALSFQVSTGKKRPFPEHEIQNKIDEDEAMIGKTMHQPPVEDGMRPAKKPRCDDLLSST